MEIVETVFSVILLIIIALLGLGSLIFGIKMIIRHSYMKRRFVAADSVVRSVSKVEEKNPDETWPMFYLTVTVEHTVDGKVFSGDYQTRVADTQEPDVWNLSPGDHFPILYDPENPRDITKDIGRKSGGNWAGIIMILIGINMLAYVVWSFVTALS